MTPAPIAACTANSRLSISGLGGSQIGSIHGLKPGLLDGDRVRALIVGAAEFALHEDQRKDHEREHRRDQQVIRAARNHGDWPWMSPSSFSTSVFCESAFITMTVRKPSAMASGTCVMAKTPKNFRNAPT